MPLFVAVTPASLGDARGLRRSDWTVGIVFFLGWHHEKRGRLFCAGVPVSSFIVCFFSSCYTARFGSRSRFVKRGLLVGEPFLFSRRRGVRGAS